MVNFPIFLKFSSNFINIKKKIQMIEKYFPVFYFQNFSTIVNGNDLIE